MHLSAGNGHLEMVKLLLERGADTLHAMNGEGEAPIKPYQVSFRSGYREIANLLGEHGAGRSRFDYILLCFKCEV